MQTIIKTVVRNLPKAILCLVRCFSEKQSYIKNTQQWPIINYALEFNTFILKPVR